jgi:multicomponent K+:H+ antiporter subunit E
MSFLSRVFPHPILSAILLVVWLLLNNTIAPGHIVLGAILAIIIPMLTSSFWPERVCFRRAMIFMKFSMIVAYDIVIANITVAKLILGPNDKLKPRLFRLPLDIEHPLGISVLASTISLTPGTVSCDLSSDRSYLIIHALCLEDKQAGIDEIKQRYEKPLMEVFTKC